MKCRAATEQMDVGELVVSQAINGYLKPRTRRECQHALVHSGLKRRKRKVLGTMRAPAARIYRTTLIGIDTYREAEGERPSRRNVIDTSRLRQVF